MEKIVDCAIDMQFREIDATTQAAVRLRMHDGSGLSAQGIANRNPDDRRQQRVGEEIAAARALNNLAEQLLSKAGDDIREVMHEDAQLTH
ncbi:dsRBD fold-containing protein [Streptomyces sp. NPDC037389]|uniref:dsRBD fold-containing protein n=1 Tax=Streptomyces sp. NPDC037389 TaxID=3155369 RepID=UPI0033D86D5B